MSENDETTNLARRAVACSAWRWMPRMLNDRGETVFRVNAQGVSVCSEGHYAYVRQAADALPDLADPATLGCLLALVREAYARPRLTPRYLRSLDDWIVNDDPDRGVPVGADGRCATEAEALVAALAPPVRDVLDAKRHHADLGAVAQPPGRDRRPALAAGSALARLLDRAALEVLEAPSGELTDRATPGHGDAADGAGTVGDRHPCRRMAPPQGEALAASRAVEARSLPGLDGILATDQAGAGLPQVDGPHAAASQRAPVPRVASQWPRSATRPPRAPRRTARASAAPAGRV